MGCGIARFTSLKKASLKQILLYTNNRNNNHIEYVIINIIVMIVMKMIIMSSLALECLLRNVETGSLVSPFEDKNDTVS